MINYLTLNLTPQEHQLLMGLIAFGLVCWLFKKLFVYVTSEGV